MQAKKILVYGITGSIGSSFVRLLRAFPEEFSLISCSAGKNIELLNHYLKEFDSIKSIAVQDEQSAMKIEFNSSMEIYTKEKGLLKLLDSKPDVVLMALPGKIGWKITLEAIKRGIPVALANKESLVIAGFFMGKEITVNRKKIIPVDSEHAAIMQLLENSNINDIEKIYITASGGALRDFSKEEMEKASVKEALNHPVWKMGKKVTIDSATMVNKGLELMEAYWLFPMEPTQLGVVVHPSVAVHAFADFKDGSALSQLAVSDMIIPISSALAYPKKLPLKQRIPHLEFNYYSGEHHFLEPDFEKYPLLKLAFEILEKKDYSAMVAYAISDEVAVDNFLEGKITIGQIHKIVSKSVEHFSNIKHPKTIDEISDFLIEIETFSNKLVNDENL